ncbi:hypothetical protein P43SY_005752 [Pythium insidiosum]|uniref:Protein kinase domain-containing protein n=1 Tax=Pythium insidiosum TaxID=114742 RepID=A0AAD5QAU5_PYTIN|nr:hypothetical protein P43SY_005752 [Pythium insidiosum]
MQCVRKCDGHVAAVKVIQDFPECHEEVAREKEALALIERAGGHANIVRFDGAYQHDGFHYIVTELPENILVVDQDGKLTLKIIDFGSAEMPSSSVSKKPTMTLSGTRCYWPPEVIRHQETSQAMDMWALGCILFIMLSGRHPFDMMGCSTESEIVERILTNESVSFVHPNWRDVPEEIKSLLRGLLDKDPLTRLGVDGLLSHPALTQARDAA